MTAPQTTQTETDLRARIVLLEQAAHRAARVMYRRGYLAGHSAGSKGAANVRGPYRKHHAKDPA